MATITHLRKNCIGCNTCTEYAPEYWAIDQIDGKSTLIGSTETKKDIFIREIPPWDLVLNRQAARSCPVKVIKLRDY